MLKAKIVSTDGVEVMPITEAIERYGAEVPGAFDHNLRLRPELQKFPRLNGLAGPMWSGNASVARYESPEVLELMSH